MSKQVAENIIRLSSSAAVEACWNQWAVLGAPITRQRSQELKSLIDPEALLLLSLSMHHHEYRLSDITSWFAATGSTLLSVQRVNTFLGRFPSFTRDRIAQFAGLAIRAGDNRWKRYLGGWLSDSQITEWEAPVLRMSSRAALVLRLRAAFGVGLKTDLLAYLFTQQGRASSVRDISLAIGYSKPAIRSATSDMASAGLLRESPDRPIEYYLDVDAWQELPGLNSHTKSLRKSQNNSQPPNWCYWIQLYAFLSTLEAWASSPETQAMSPYLLSSKARDLFFEHEKAFSMNHISVPGPARFEGTEYLEAFQNTIETIAIWIQEHL